MKNELTERSQQIKPTCNTKSQRFECRFYKE